MPKYLVKIRGKKIDYSRIPKGYTKKEITITKKTKAWKGAKVVVAKDKATMLKKVIGKPTRVKRRRRKR
jgi:hypothetical protein